MKAEGYVKWYNMNEGFGFAEANLNGKEVDVFLHFSELQNGVLFRLQEGDCVAFEIDETSAKRQAKNIVFVN